MPGPLLNIATQTPLTGFSITVPNNVNYLRLKPAGTLATGTVTLPAAPEHGQLFSISSSQIVTALTMSVITGQTLVGGLTALAVNTTGRWVYNAVEATWLPT